MFVIKKTDLLKLPEITRGRLRREQVFSDFVELFAIRISSLTDPVHSKARNDRAKTLIQNYEKHEQSAMLEYFSEIVRLMKDHIDKGEVRDVLGSLFEELYLSHQGQDQTPNNLARLISKLTFACPEIPASGYIDLDEPTCGSGTLVLAAAETLLENSINYCEHLVVRATDVDLRCVHMAYIQLSMYGIPAVVIHGNAIALEEFDRWYTPMYVHGKWVWRHPLTLTGKPCADDEMLKRLTDPEYNAWRRVENLLIPETPACPTPESEGKAEELTKNKPGEPTPPVE